MHFFKNVPVAILFCLIAFNTWADSRVTSYIQLMEQSLNTSTLLYSRISPDIAALIKPIKMPPESKEVVSCLFRKIDEQNLEQQFGKSITFTKQFLKYIRETPTLTVMTLESDTQYQAMQQQSLAPEFDGLTKITKSCGLLDLNIKLTRQSGLMEAFKLMPQD